MKPGTFYAFAGLTAVAVVAAGVAVSNQSETTSLTAGTDPAFAKLAKDAGKRVIVDLGGADEKLDDRLYDLVDYLSPNEHECGKLKATPEELIKMYPHMRILLKKGADGSQLLSKDGNIEVPAFDFNNFPSLKLVDTTSAGDTYTAGFAIGLMEHGDEK